MVDTLQPAAWAQTSVGQVREHNEDAYLIDDALQLYAVADGMGGHAAGEVASRMTLECVQRVIREGQERIAAHQAEPASRQAAREVLRLLEEAVREACAAVHELGQRDEGKRGMGTTLCVVLAAGGHAFIAHVGDSRVYLVRGDRAHQLTVDHTLQNELLKRGRLSPEEIARVEQKNALTRAIGVYPSVEVDTLKVELSPGDRLVLCSDGLYSYLRKGELQSILQGPAEQAPERFVALANRRGGHDNITAVVISTGEVRETERAKILHLTLETLRKASLFRYLNYQELMKTANLTETLTFLADETIFREGEEGDALFIVLSGKVRVHRDENTLVEFGPGEHFGEMALVDREPRSATVTALEETRLTSLKRADFLYLIKHEREIAVKLLWQFIGVLTSRLRNTSRELHEARGRLSLLPLSPLEPILLNEDDLEDTL